MPFVRSVFMGEDGHEEVVHGSMDCRDFEGRGSWASGERDLSPTQYLGRHDVGGRKDCIGGFYPVSTGG